MQTQQKLLNQIDIFFLESLNLIKTFRNSKISFSPVKTPNFLLSNLLSPNPIQTKSKILVLEFFFKTDKEHYLTEQWIFDLNLTNMPKNKRIFKEEKELSIALSSLYRSISVLLINMPIFREFIRGKERSLDYDFELELKIINKMSEISHFEGLTTEKWMKYYGKIPKEDEFQLYIGLDKILKLSIQINYLKDLYTLYKEPVFVKKNSERQRNRAISEKILPLEEVKWGLEAVPWKNTKKICYFNDYIEQNNKFSELNSENHLDMEYSENYHNHLIELIEKIKKRDHEKIENFSGFLKNIEKLNPFKIDKTNNNKIIEILLLDKIKIAKKTMKISSPYKNNCRKES